MGRGVGLSGFTLVIRRLICYPGNGVDRLLIISFYSYEHFDGGGCRLFRNEDYLPPEDKGPKEVTAPEDLQVLETALVSVCPRCGEVCTHKHTLAVSDTKLLMHSVWLSNYWYMYKPNDYNQGNVISLV